jgi:hypothetical protein
MMTGCDVVYQLVFRDGTPRYAVVSVSLKQIVQTNEGVKMKGFGDSAPAQYNMTGGVEGLDNNAGRKVNGIDPSGVK